MRAIQYTRIGGGPELVDIPRPVPGPGQVLLKITAAGVCHSDAFVMGLSEERFLSRYGELPLTLGHEAAGRVVELGAGVDGIDIDTNVVVYGPWGCGTCLNCAQGMENYCARAAELQIRPPGLGAPGAAAEFMIVDSVRHLVPIGELDPVATVPLTDAGLTPYHAIKRSLNKLRPGSVAVVIGIGGLGHIAIQLLRHLSPTHIVAVDQSEDQLDLARAVGAHDVVISDSEAPLQLRRAVGTGGATLVLDFVGVQATIDLAMAVAGSQSDVTIVGVGDGRAAAEVGFFRGAYETNVAVTYWGSRPELIELIELARQGVIHTEVERFDLESGVEAYRRMMNGDLRGRAVITPDGKTSA